MLLLESINQFIADVIQLITSLLFGFEICSFTGSCFRCRFPFDCF